MTADTLSPLKRLANDTLCDAADELWTADPLAGYQDHGHSTMASGAGPQPFSPDLLPEEYDGAWDNAVSAYERR